jgi:hypothetical protein
MTVYLLHAQAPLGGEGRSSARHYVGYCDFETLLQRLAQHANGQGARITRAFIEKGELWCVRVWPEGTHRLERRMKQRGHISDYCPVCRTVPYTYSGWPASVQLSPQSPLYSLRSLRRVNANGGVSSPGSGTGATGFVQAELFPATATSSRSGRRRFVPLLGGGVSSVRARPRRAGSIWPAGTRLRSISGYARTLLASALVRKGSD